MLLNYKKLHDPVTESEINALYCMLRKHTRYYEKVNLNEHGEYGFYTVEEDMLKISDALPTAQYNIVFDNDVTVSGIVDDDGTLNIPLTDYSVNMQVNISFPQHIVTIVPDYNIVLSADKTSMYSDESCTLTAVLTKEGEAWSGQSVALYQSDVLVDTLVTGADGSVSFVVGGLSSGEYVFKAVVGSVESNIVSVAVLEHSYDLELSCSTPIIQKEGTAIVNAVLTRDNVAVSGKSLDYVVKHGDSILDSGSVVTGSDGKASISYTGTGVGDVDVIVSYGTLLQETFVLWDTIAYDNGTSLNHNDIWQTPTNQGKLIREDEYSNLIETIASDTAIGVLLPSQNIKMEFDLFNVDGGTQNFYNVNIRKTNNTYITGFGLNEMGCNVGLWHHIICEIGEGSFNVRNTTNTRTINNRTLSTTESQILFQIKTDGANTNLRFKNFKVYENIVDYDLTLSSDKDILSAHDRESATITALLTEDNIPIEDIELEYSIKHDNTVIDSGTITTNSDGEANIVYTATGVGDVDVIISYGTLLQETFVIQDLYYYDSQTVDKSRYSVTTGSANISYSNDGVTISGAVARDTLVKNTALTLPTNYMAEITLTNINGESVPNKGLAYGGLCFDNLLIDMYTTQIDLYLLNQLSSLSTINTGVSNGDVIKIEMNNGTMKLYINNVLKATETVNNTGVFQNRTFKNGNDPARSITSKDLKVLEL